VYSSYIKITAVFPDQTVSLAIPSEVPSEVNHDVHPGLSA